MKKFVFLTAVFFMLTVQVVKAETPESEFALFKRTISPVYKWGENGVLTIPKATTIGKANLYLGGNAQDAGKIEDKQLFLTGATIMVGSSSDVELGYTKRQLIWDDGKKSDFEMDTFHLKARVLHITNDYLPQIAVGVNAVSLKENQFNNKKDILFNPYAVATIRIPIFTENAVLSVSGVVETISNENESARAFYSAGADLMLFKKLFLMAEMQGINKEKSDSVINLGAKYKIGWLSIGAGMFNIVNKESGTSVSSSTAKTDNAYWMAHATLDIPLGDLFSGKKETEKK